MWFVFTDLERTSPTTLWESWKKQGVKKKGVYQFEPSSGPLLALRKMSGIIARPREINRYVQKNSKEKFLSKRG
jgi:hypothetical protein